MSLFESDVLNLGSANTLLLLDRGFYHFQFWQQLMEKKVDFITRIKKGASFQIHQVFSNSYGLRDRLIIIGSGSNNTPILTLRLNAPKSVRWLRWLPPFLRSLLIQNKLDLAFQTEQVTCQLKTLSAIVQEHEINKIDLLKIDVEKSELDVLLGIEALDWQKIEQIVVEVHGLENRLQKIENLLKEYGFTEIKVAQESMLKGSNLFNLYARRESNSNFQT